MKININEIVRVKLTDKGIQTLKTKYEKLNKASNGLIDCNAWETMYIDNDGYYKAPIWQLMQDFGRQMYMGNVPVFEHGTIEVLE